MARALRHTAPQGGRQMIVRPRLLATMRGRFERAVTVVVAKPGAGKTTLLAQAVSENAMAPRGRDCWLTCQRDDTSLSVLAQGAFTAVGLRDPVPEEPRRAAALLADAMWSAAPADVALVLDDAHHLSPGSPGAAFLDALLVELPGNGHVVLGWRTDPGLEAGPEDRPTSPVPPGVSRLLASEDALLIGDAELQFTDQELAAFADSRDVAASVLADVGGWPALAELAASVGKHAVVAYLWDQLLSELPRERRHALAVLAEVGGADDEIASALLGRRVQLSRLLDGLPLVVRDGAGWWSLHALWAAALQHLLDEAEVAQARRAAGRLLAQRGQYHDAMDLLLDAEAWPDALEVIVDVCKVCTPLAPQDFLEIWWSRLPGPCRERPEGLLLRAMIVEPSDPGAAEHLLTEALADADSPNLQYACVNALVQVAFWRNDRHTLTRLVGRLDHLLQGGFTEAAPWLPILTALLEPSVDRARRALLSAPSPPQGRDPVQQWLLAHLLLRKLGEAVHGEHAARRSLEDSSTTMRAVSRAALIEALALQGRLDEAREMLPDLEKEMEPTKLLTSPELLTHAVVLSDLTAPPFHAASLIERCAAVVARSPVAWAPLAMTFAEVFHAVTVGDEAAAVASLDRVGGVPLIHNRSISHLTTAAVPLLYVLVPTTRRAWDDDRSPDGLGDLLAATRALVALRERGSVAEVADLAPRARLLARTMMPVPWAAELALGMVAAGVPQGRDLLEELRQRARPVLRARTASPHPVLARTAKALLRTLPVKPALELDLRTLGRAELRRAGTLDQDALRRERVRHLLAYLLTHGRPTRAEIMEALWPELSESAARANLRVTLAYLHDALEPDRREGDATYFVRSSGPVLHLVVGDGLQVDVVEFERELEEARRLEDQGVPSQALEALRRGLEQWRGDYFAETEGEGWLGEHRDRLRHRFIDAAVRAGQLLTAAGDLGAAEALAERALGADPWEERAHQVLVQASLAAGDLRAASTRLTRCLEMLRDLGVPPASHTVTLAEQVRSTR